MSMKAKAYRVSKIVDYMKELIEDDMFLCSVFIEGEISNYRKHSSGHLYFSLKDEIASLRCCIFKNDAIDLPFAPKDGDFVQIYGRVSIYKKSGDLQFIGEFMNISGKGKIHHDLEKLKEKLQTEGIFNNQREIPKYPSCVAVVTSLSGAAVYDIIRTIKRRNPLIKVIISPALVQGEGSPESIASAIENANNNSGADVLIVGRGGGSVEDLWAFNTEIVARAVFNSKIPVISAVGHEIDFTVSDFAADFRASTPTAAAEIAVPLLSSMHEELSFKTSSIYAVMQKRLKFCRTTLDNFYFRLSPKREIEKISNQRKTLEMHTLTMNYALNSKLSRLKAALTAKADIIEKISPIAVLKRGFTLVANHDGKILTEGKKIETGQKINIQFSDTIRKAEIL